MHEMCIRGDAQGCISCIWQNAQGLPAPPFFFFLSLPFLAFAARLGASLALESDPLRREETQEIRGTRDERGERREERVDARKRRERGGV